MKIILSHDVDHLFMQEHWRDSFIPGLIKRTALSLSRRQLSISQAVRRFSATLNNVDDLATFNADKELPQTFFFGMARGLNLSYQSKAAAPLIRYLADIGVDVGLHGIAYDDVTRMRAEKQQLADILGAEPQFIRNHYLRMAPQTHSIMASIGYSVDSSLESLEPPWQVDTLWVLPISLMDASLYGRAAGRLSEMRSLGISRVEEALTKGLPYFVVNFHDIYFSDGYPVLRAWYTDFVSEMLDRGYEFCSFSDAARELNECYVDPDRLSAD